MSLLPSLLALLVVPKISIFLDLCCRYLRPEKSSLAAMTAEVKCAAREQVSASLVNDLFVAMLASWK